MKIVVNTTFGVFGVSKKIIIESQYGMTINNRDININVKKCFVYN